MAWIAPLLGNPGDVLDRVRSPRELARALSAADLLFPETSDSADGLPCDGTWIAKTYRGASGSGVRVLSETGRGREGANGSAPVFFQKRIPGIPCAAAFVEIDGAVELLGVTRQLIGESWLGAHGFQYAGSIGPQPIEDAVRRSITRIGQVLADRFELIGLFGVDFILDGDQVWTIEVNPRYTASMEICERTTGTHVIASHVAGMPSVPVSSLQPSTHVPNRAHGKAILFARRDIVISAEFAEPALAEALRVPWPTLADIPIAGSQIGAGRPIITVFADGFNIDEVEQRLQLRVAELEQQIYCVEVPQ
jgi:predicted ATP-grasp superfamily ATP-dependent carboligase